MRKEKAIYTKAILPEHQGNPLIEALPTKESLRSVMAKFSFYPCLDEEIRVHPDPLIREEYTTRIKTLRQPLPLYFECFRAIETALKAGYSAKNPLTPTTAQYLHYLIDDRPDIEPITGFFAPKADSITLIGESGVGKTSMLEQILNYFPNVIEHDVYNGNAIDFKKQVVWVKVDCPNNSSVRDLCEEILIALDIASEAGPTRPESTIGKLMRQIEHKIKTNFLGILVIDEMQRLVFKRTGGENNLLNFLHSLVNKLGVPLLFCANPPFDDTLTRSLKAARRAESGGYFTMEPLTRDSHAWDCFINELWDLHWTNVSTELSEELNDKIFDLSCGNLDMAHRIYRDAQRLVIGSPDERITIAVLEQAYIKACGLSSRTDEVQTLRKGNILPRRVAQDKGHKSKTNKSIILGDISRPHHSEFETAIRMALSNSSLLEQIQEPELLRGSISEPEPMRYLAERGVLFSKLLSDYG